MKTNVSLTLVRAFWAMALGSLLFMSGCGSEPAPAASSATEYPAGISEDIEQQLKYDARVESSELDGEDLVVSVNDSWASSPQGMQERAMGQWYSLWHAQHGSGKVIVKYNGAAVATWSDKGYKPENPNSGEAEAASKG